MKLKVALVLLVLAFSVTAIMIASSVPTLVSLPTIRSLVLSSRSLIKPLGDPVPGPGFPH